MSNIEAILVLDCGTSGVKSSLLPRPTDKETPRLLPVRKIDMTTIDGSTGTKRVWQPAILLKHVTEALLWESQRAKDKGLKVVGIGLTSTTSSTVALQGQYILPMPPPLRWDDQQSHKEADLLERIRKKTNSMPWMEPIKPDSGVSKALWQISNYPGDFTALDSITVEQWTLLNWFLTEKIVLCETILGRKWGWTKSRPWPANFKKELGNLLRQLTLSGKNHDEAYDEFRKHALYGEIRSAGEDIGQMAWEMSESLGFGSQPRVFAVPFDTFAQILGMGMTQPCDDIGITFGTSQGICAVLSASSPAGSAQAALIPDAPVRETSMVFDGIASCGSAITFVCENYGFTDQNGDIDTDQIKRCLEATEPGAQGIMMLPYYNGGRRVSRGTQVDGKIEGLNQGKDKANIIRALFESIAFITRGIINDFEQNMERGFKRVLASGRPTSNDLFMQILASVLGREVVLFRQADATLVGCAICVAKGLGWYSSLTDAGDNLVDKKRIVSPDAAQSKEYESLYKAYYQRFSTDIPLTSSIVPSQSGGVK